MSEYDLLRSRTKTKPIRPSDRGTRSDTLDLAIQYDPATRTYNRR